MLNYQRVSIVGFTQIVAAPQISPRHLGVVVLESARSLRRSDSARLRGRGKGKAPNVGSNARFAWVNLCVFFVVYTVIVYIYIYKYIII